MPTVIPRAVSIEIQSLSPSALVELFTVDMSSLGGQVVHFHAGTNGLQQPVVWQGMTYQPLPIEVEGFDVSTQGTLPRPKLRIANTGGYFSVSVKEMDDMVTSKVTRRRTFLRFLDAVNFPGGVNANANPTQHFADDVFYIDRKVSEDPYMIEWELASAFDLEGVKLPFRQVIQNSCQWRYRGAECGYMKSDYYDINDSRVWDESKDTCGKRLLSCERRFGEGVIIPFGGFPGATRYG